MESTVFKITIDAPKEKVWNSLWEDASYREWTSPFAPDSRAETDWKKGSKILFLDAKNSGMVSTVADAKPNELMSIKHLGIVKAGVEDLESEESKLWTGSMENYYLKTVNGKTDLTVDLIATSAIPKDLMDHFKDAWPKALDKLKALAENN